MADLIAIVDDERFDAHRERSGRHPECPERLAAARSGLYGTLPEEARVKLEARPAEDVELSAVHSPDYVKQLLDRLVTSARRFADEKREDDLTIVVVRKL